MENKRSNGLSLFQHFGVLTIDFTATYFLFHIVRFSISYFYFLPFFPSFFILWCLYYILTLGIYKQTLGTGFYGATLTSKNNKPVSWGHILLREILTSIPGIALCILYFVYSPIYLLESTIPGAPATILFARVIFILTLLIIAALRVKVFGVKTTLTQTATLKSTRKQVAIVYAVLLIFAGVSRYTHISLTNDMEKIYATTANLFDAKDTPPNLFDRIGWRIFMSPRPSVTSTEEHITFLNNNRQDINDYIFELYKQYDHLILCERTHPEMTQYDMIYNLVTDERFVHNVGNVFTELGAMNSREAYQELTNTSFPNDTLFQQALSSFMMDSQSLYLLWPHTNWYQFLERMYHFNHHNEKRVNVLFTDCADSAYNDVNLNRDSIMAANIVSTIKSDTLKKSLTIMNFRHAYLKDRGNCGYHVAEAFPGKVANILINTVNASRFPTQYGTWDVAFEQMPNDAFAFSLKDSPFGEDGFDHIIFISPLSKLKYKDMFTGVIYYKPLYQHVIGDGFPYMMQPDNVVKLRERATYLNVPFNEEQYYYLEGGRFRDAKTLYYLANLLDNLFFIWNLIWGVGILIYISIGYRKTRSGNNLLT